MERILFLTSRMIRLEDVRREFRKVKHDASDADCALICNKLVAMIGLPKYGPWSEQLREDIRACFETLVNVGISANGMAAAEELQEVNLLNQLLRGRMFSLTEPRECDDGCVEITITPGCDPLVLSRNETLVRTYLSARGSTPLRLESAEVRAVDGWIVGGSRVRQGGFAVRSAPAVLQPARPRREPPLGVMRGVIYQEVAERSVYAFSGGAVETSRRRH